MAAHLPGWSHTYLLYWHAAAVSKQRSSVTPTVLSARRACPSSDPCPCRRSAVPSTSCSPRKLLRNDSLFSVQTASSRSVAMEWDQIAVATRLWRWWGVRLSWRSRSYSTSSFTAPLLSEWERDRDGGELYRKQGKCDRWTCVGMCMFPFQWAEPGFYHACNLWGFTFRITSISVPPPHPHNTSGAANKIRKPVHMEGVNTQSGAMTWFFRDFLVRSSVMIDVKPHFFSHAEQMKADKLDKSYRIHRYVHGIGPCNLCVWVIKVSVGKTKPSISDSTSWYWQALELTVAGD